MKKWLLLFFLILFSFNSYAYLVNDYYTSSGNTDTTTSYTVSCGTNQLVIGRFPTDSYLMLDGIYYITQIEGEVIITPITPSGGCKSQNKVCIYDSQCCTNLRCTNNICKVPFITERVSTQQLIFYTAGIIAIIIIALFMALFALYIGIWKRKKG